MFPNEKVLFQIPIYSMPEKEFEQRWNREREKHINLAVELGNSKEEAEKIFYSCYYPQYVWRYNQVVGFVEIAVTRQDIVFNVYKTLDTRIRAVSKSKHFIQNNWNNGSHFPVERKSNDEILCGIENELASIAKGLPNKMCLDLEAYDVVKEHIDFRGIWESLY